MGRQNVAESGKSNAHTGTGGEGGEKESGKKGRLYGWGVPVILPVFGGKGSGGLENKERSDEGPEWTDAGVATHSPLDNLYVEQRQKNLTGRCLEEIRGQPAAEWRVGGVNTISKSGIRCR